MRYKSADWSVELPGGWSGKDDEICVTFEGPNLVGALQISSYRKFGDVTAEDLLDFADSTPLIRVTCGSFSGFQHEQHEQDTYWLKWWLRCGQTMIFATYNCEPAHQGLEESDVQLIMQSLLAGSMDS